MKKISKRLLAVLISASVILTLIPSFAVTAQAASITSTHLVGAYLVDNITDGIAVNHGVEWNDGWAVFNGDQGDYLKIDGHPMESVSHTKEFTVAFSFNKTDKNSESRIFEFTDGTVDNNITADKHFSFVGGSSGWYQYNVLFRNKDFKDYDNGEGQQRVYYGNDWTNGNYTESNAGQTAPGIMSNNTDYSVVINMNTAGKLSVYVNGELRVTFKSDYATWGIAGRIAGYLFDGACYSLFKDLTDYYIGSAQSGHYFDGKIKNLYLFDKALSASEVDTEVDVSTSNLSDLTNQMYAYEEKFQASNDVYINMTPAYDAYRRAWRIFDTRNETNGYNLRSTTPKDIGLAAAILYHTTQNMTVWNAYSGTAIPSANGNSGINTPSSFTHSTSGTTIRPYNNMLYTAAWHIWGGGNHTDNHALLMDNRGCVYVYYPNTALLYDGVENNTYFPLTAWLQSDGTGSGHNSSRFVFEIYPTTSSAATGNRPSDTRFTFYDRWHAVSNNTTYDNIAAIHSTQSYIGTTYNSGQCSWDFNNTEYFLANVMFFNDAGNLAQAESGYNSYSLNWTVNAAGNSTWYDSDSNLNKTATHDCNIYVIDYSKVKTAINNYAASKIGSLNRVTVANYKEGGYEDIFAAFDKATYDPNVAFCNGIPHDKNDIRNASKLAGLSSVDGASAVASATATVDNPSGFSALRNYLNYNANPTNYTGPGILNTNAVYNGFNDDKMFTTSSYNEFVYKYTEAQNELGLVYQTDGAYSRKTQAESAATALINAYNALEQTADFSALDAAYSSAKSAQSSLDSSIYTTSSVSVYNNYLNDDSNFPYHSKNADDRYDTGVSSQSAIADEANSLSTAQTRILDPRANVATLTSSFDTADAFLKGLENQEATYTEDSINAIIAALEANGVSTYYNADTSDLSGKTYQTTINSLESAISTAYEGREEVDFPEEALTGYEAAYEKLEKLDPDAYEENEEHSIATAKSGAEALYTTTTYAGKTINVVTEDVASSDMDKAITTMLTALRNCVKMYNISTDSGVEEISANNGTYYIEDNKSPFGTKLNFTAKDPETVWYLEVDSGTMQRKKAFQGFGDKLEVKTVGDITVSTKTRGTGERRVKIVREYSNNSFSPIQLVDFVENTFDLPAAPAIAYYNFAGYYLKGSEDRLDNPSASYPQNISISADTEIVAKYTYNHEADCAVNAKTLEGGSASIPDAVAYNTRIDLEGGEGAYGWSVNLGNGNYRPFYVGADLTMYATDTMNLVAEDEETFNAHRYDLPNIFLRESGAVTSGTKTIFNAQVVAVDMDKVKESGILVAVGNSKQPGSSEPVTPVVPSDSQIIVENSGQQTGFAVLRAKSTKFVGANQISIAVNNLPSGYAYRGYLIYQDKDGNLQTVYTDVKTASV